MTIGEHIPQEDLALYAMHGSSDQDSASVRSHVASCPQCRAELETISSDLSLVALAVDRHPLPDGARRRFLDKLSETKQSDATLPAAPLPPRPLPLAPVIPIRKSQPPAWPIAWAPWAVAAILAMVVVSLEVKFNSLNRSLETESAQFAAANARAQQVLDLLTAPAAQRVLLTSAKSPRLPSARAVYLPSRGALILEASNLGQLPTGRTYELWVIPANGAAPIPAGLFRPDAAGSASVVLPQLPIGVPAKAFGVTIERAEGSPTPTLPIVLAGAAPAS